LRGFAAAGDSAEALRVPISRSAHAGLKWRISAILPDSLHEV
jgi:hypothetical protein